MKEEGLQHIYLVIKFVVILLGCLIITQLFMPFWINYYDIFHMAIETICIFIGVLIFIIGWYTYERSEWESSILGFGFLTVAIYDSFHAFFYRPLGISPEYFIDMNVKFRVLGRFTIAIVLLILVLGIVKFKLNKWVSLLISLLAPTIIAGILFHFPKILPSFTGNSAGSAFVRVLIECIIIIIFFIDLFFLIRDKRNRLYKAYKYIFISILLSISVEVCFSIHQSSISSYCAMSHILKLFCYFLLFRGIFVEAVQEPYEKLKESMNYTEELLNKIVQQDRLAVVGQMGAAIVHETKNFLAVIKGSSQLLTMYAKDDKIKEIAKRIDVSTNEVNRIVGGLLTFSKPGSGTYSPNSINKLVQSMRSTLETSSLLHGVDVEIYLDEDEKPVYCDESQIMQVIMNLCKNAIEAMGQGKNPVLVIKTHYNSRDNEMDVGISDNGKGMTEDEKKYIGTPFYTTKEKGTGLGLSICYKIIGDHGGRIDVESGIGKGSSFNFHLPCVPE
jgi:Signal transduction histidine kinase regulating C4-dicarboxylate transport system